MKHGHVFASKIPVGLLNKRSASNKQCGAYALWRVSHGSAAASGGFEGCQQRLMPGQGSIATEEEAKSEKRSNRSKSCKEQMQRSPGSGIRAPP